MERQAIAIGNAEALHKAGQSLLDTAGEITSRTGENSLAMAEIGNLLRAFQSSGVLDELLAVRPAGKRAAVDVIAQHSDGSILSLYAMENWQSPPSTDIHWHNYWQTLLGAGPIRFGGRHLGSPTIPRTGSVSTDTRLSRRVSSRPWAPTNHTAGSPKKPSAPKRRRY